MQNVFKEGIKVSIISILVNIFLSIFKFITGLLGNSNALISDSIHSLADVLSTVVVIIGLKLSSKSEDKKHPYGHERMECVAAFILSFFLFFTGISIGSMGIKTILSSSSIESPTTLALIAALLAILVKEITFLYTRKIAKKINSSSLMAEAWHHQGDVLSSIGSLIGIGGAMLGFTLLDSIASILICLCIMRVALNIFIDSVNKMIDKSCDDDFVEKLKFLISKTEGVLNIDSIKTRLFGNKIYVDIIISANGNLSLYESHEIVDNIHNNIENNFKDIKNCMIYVNPKV